MRIRVWGPWGRGIRVWGSEGGGSGFLGSIRCLIGDEDVGEMKKSLCKTTRVQKLLHEIMGTFPMVTAYETTKANIARRHAYKHSYSTCKAHTRVIHTSRTSLEVQFLKGFRQFSDHQCPKVSLVPHPAFAGGTFSFSCPSPSRGRLCLMHNTRP